MERHTVGWQGERPRREKGYARWFECHCHKGNDSCNHSYPFAWLRFLRQLGAGVDMCLSRASTTDRAVLLTLLPVSHLSSFLPVSSLVTPEMGIVKAKISNVLTLCFFNTRPRNALVSKLCTVENPTLKDIIFLMGEGLTPKISSVHTPFTQSQISSSTNLPALNFPPSL